MTDKYPPNLTREEIDYILNSNTFKEFLQELLMEEQENG
jgi:hypothetical protein